MESLGNWFGQFSGAFLQYEQTRQAEKTNRLRIEAEADADRREADANRRILQNVLLGGAVLGALWLLKG